MSGSIDSLSLVRTYPGLRPAELFAPNFKKKRDKFGSWKWIDNGMLEIHEPQLTFYRTWGGIFRLRVDLNIAKLYYGWNTLLPNRKDLRDVLPLISTNVRERTGLDFDAFGAEVHRVHYAFNHQTERSDVRRVIAHYKNYNVPRMETTVKRDGYNETVYFQNKSRGMRVYDKQAQTIKKNPIPELVEKAAGITRFELYINGGTPVKRFAKRMGFKDCTAREMMSERSINAANSEMRMLLGFDNPELTAQSTLDVIFQKTGDLKKASLLFSFLEALKCYGKEFYQNRIYNFTKTTYYRRLRECQKLGLCPLG